MNRQSTEAVEGSENISSHTTMVDTDHYTFVKTHSVYDTKNELYINMDSW